jgi:hypothetical protein
MKKNISTIFLLSCINWIVNANNIDTIKITNPTYYSDFERNNFENYLKSNKADVFALSLSVDSFANLSNEKAYRESMRKYLSSIKSDVNRIQIEKSKINKVFKTASASYFVQYDINSYCSKFYTEGKFNCVTGSLFFSFLMDSLYIPYIIKEKPSHVFILAYPNTFSIPVESTDPNLISFIPNETFKKNYVDFLVDSKIILKSDVNSKGTEAIFNENYYSDKNIKPIELVGLLYTNSGINYLNDKNYLKAIQQFEKAYILYPSERIRFLLEVSLIDLADNIDESNLDQLDYLCKLSNYTKKE